MSNLDGVNAEFHVDLLVPDLLERVHDNAHVVQIPDGSLQLALHLADDGVDVVHLSLVLFAKRLSYSVRARFHFSQQTELQFLGRHEHAATKHVFIRLLAQPRLQLRVEAQLLHEVGQRRLLHVTPLLLALPQCTVRMPHLQVHTQLLKRTQGCGRATNCVIPRPLSEKGIERDMPLNNV